MSGFESGGTIEEFAISFVRFDGADFAVGVRIIGNSSVRKNVI